MKKFSTRILSIILPVVLLGMIASACASAATQTPGKPTKTAPTQAGVATPAPAGPADTVETTTNQVPEKSLLGQLSVQYPILINPGSSKTISLQISIPAELANASPESFKRDVRDPSSPRPLGKLNEYNALILVMHKMRVELAAPNFKIEALYPLEQELDLTTPEAATHWGWTITAPEEPNEYVLVVKVYMGSSAVPTWVGSFDVIVAAPTQAPLPSPTFTPTPKSIGERILDDIIDNATTLIGAILTAIVALIGLYLQFRKPRDGKK